MFFPFIIGFPVIGITVTFLFLVGKQSLSLIQHIMTHAWHGVLWDRKPSWASFLPGSSGAWPGDPFIWVGCSIALVSSVAQLATVLRGRRQQMPPPPSPVRECTTAPTAPRCPTCPADPKEDICKKLPRCFEFSGCAVCWGLSQRDTIDTILTYPPKTLSCLRTCQGCDWETLRVAVTG